MSKLSSLLLQLDTSPEYSESISTPSSISSKHLKPSEEWFCWNFLQLFSKNKLRIHEIINFLDESVNVDCRLILWNRDYTSHLTVDILRHIVSRWVTCYAGTETRNSHTNVNQSGEGDNMVYTYLNVQKYSWQTKYKQVNLPDECHYEQSYLVKESIYKSNCDLQNCGHHIPLQYLISLHHQCWLPPSPSSEDRTMVCAVVYHDTPAVCPQSPPVHCELDHGEMCLSC